MRNFFCSLCFVLLAACTSQADVVPPPPPSGPPPPAPNAPFSQNNLEAVRAYHSRSDGVPSPSEAGRAVAFVILDRKKTGRNRELCEAFENLPAEEIAEEMGGTTIAPTYWLLLGKPPARNPDWRQRCDQLIADFDYEVADAIAQRAGLPTNGKPGIVAFDGDYQFYIDMSAGSDSDTEKAMRGWFSAATAAGGKSGIKLANRIERICGTSLMAEYQKRRDEARALTLNTPGGAMVEAADLALEPVKMVLVVADRGCSLFFNSEQVEA